MLREIEVNRCSLCNKYRSFYGAYLFIKVVMHMASYLDYVSVVFDMNFQIHNFLAGGFNCF